MAGNLAYTVSQFLMLWSVVRLTDEQRVGQYALAMALTAPVFIFAGLKMRHVQVTDAGGLNRSGEYIAVRMITSVLAFAACIALGILVAGNGPLLDVVVAVACFKAVESQVDVLYGVMQRRERLDLVARSMVLRGLSGALVFILVLAYTDSVPVAVGALAVATLVFVFSDSVTVHRLGASPLPEFTGWRLARLTWLAIPLGLSVSVGSLTTNMPRYLLEAFEGTASVGIFATIAYVLVAVSLIGGSAAEAASPRLSNLYHARDRTGFIRLTKRLALFGLCLGLSGIVIAALLGRPALSVLFGPVYAEHLNVLLLLTVAATVQFVALAVGAAVYAMRLFAIQVPINLLGLLVSAVAGALFIPHYGLTGAALSVVATQVLVALCYTWLYLRHVRPPLSGQSRNANSHG